MPPLHLGTVVPMLTPGPLALLGVTVTVSSFQACDMHRIQTSEIGEGESANSPVTVRVGRKTSGLNPTENPTENPVGRKSSGLRIVRVESVAWAVGGHRCPLYSSQNPILGPRAMGPAQ